MTDQFFEDQSAPAVLKHGILRRYLRPFATKTGQYAPGHRVVYLDGYAGPGQYTSGQPGSPSLAAATADRIRGVRNLECIFIEENHREYQALREMFADDDTCFAREGSISDHLDWALQKTGDAPLFAFMDPFGLGDLPLDRIITDLLGRTQKTEVMLNLSRPGFHRNAGHLTSTSTEEPYRSKTRPTFIAKVDAAMGGDWWQEIWLEHHNRPEPLRDPVECFQAIVDGYTNLIDARTGGTWSWVSVPVAYRWNGPPVYHLLFLTRHRDGLWVFANTLSTAIEEYREHCEAREAEASGPQQQLIFESPKDRAAGWVKMISGNIERLLDEGPVNLGDQVVEVYQGVFGFAREMHVRRALKDLYGRDVTITDPTGVRRLNRLVVHPGPASGPR